MNVEPIIFFEMTIAILVLAAALIAVVIHSVRIAGKPEASKKNDDLLEEARIRAVKLIDDANNRALDIVNKTNLSTDITSEKFSEEIVRASSSQMKIFEKTTSDFIKIYSQTLQDLKSKNIELFQNISKDIETNATEEVDSFRKSMEKLTTLSQKEVKEKIDTDYATLTGEIEEYKNAQLKKIDADVYTLLEKISKLVLGKALNLSEHEDLVQKSLEMAKKEGVFKP